MSELAALADRVETAPKYWGDIELDVEVLAAFGLTLRLYERSGWKLLDPISGRACGPIYPTRHLKDVLSMFWWAKVPVPEMIATDPRKATAAALRARAALDQPR